MEAEKTVETSVETKPENEAYAKFCEVAKDIGVSDATIALIKKDLKMETSEEEPVEEKTEEAKPEVKAVEVSVEKVSPMAEMLSSLIKGKTGC